MLYSAFSRAKTSQRLSGTSPPPFRPRPAGTTTPRRPRRGGRPDFLLTESSGAREYPLEQFTRLQEQRRELRRQKAPRRLAGEVARLARVRRHGCPLGGQVRT